MEGNQTTRCETVLIVEDEILIAMELEEILTEQGYTVLGPFASVERALDILESTRPDAAVLDYSVRGEAITPVAERLRSLDVPMVVASANFASDAHLADTCEALAGAKSVGKPIDERRLFYALRPGGM